jgi:DNA-directed RNA polymerase subunit RPC12/RpoP
MLVFGIGVALLVALVAAAERYAGHFWQGSTHRAIYACAECGRRYPRSAIHDARFQYCPHGHRIADVQAQGHASLVVIAAGLSFAAAAAVLLILGIVPVQ